MTLDGRYIDPAIASLQGEASQQAAPESPVVPPTTPPPIIKTPVWIWSIPVYFFVGGIGGAAMTLGFAAQLAGGLGLRGFDERCRWTGAIAGGVGSALLIHDLGRKGRFLFMLRVFRATSPMSVGSWVLALATPLSLASALLPRPLSSLAGLGAGVLGMPLATYTGVLIGNTAVPLWSATRRSLPILFGASAMASLASVFELMELDGRERAIVRRFGAIGRVAEIAASARLEAEARRQPAAARPLRDGVSGALWNAAAVCTVASLAFSVIPGNSRPKRAITGVFGILGGLCLRFALFYGGKRSVSGA